MTLFLCPKNGIGNVEKIIGDSWTGKAVAMPVAALVLFGIFFGLIGIYYLIRHGHKIRRALRRIVRRRHFWDYVTAAFLFVGFAAFFLFLDFRY